MTAACLCDIEHRVSYVEVPRSNVMDVDVL
jgi:hypothetical protein